jgi:hypothetical protein
VLPGLALLAATGFRESVAPLEFSKFLFQVHNRSIIAARNGSVRVSCVTMAAGIRGPGNSATLASYSGQLLWAATYLASCSQH